MPRPVPPLVLVVAAALLESGDQRRAAFYLLVAAVPVAAFAALGAFADLVDAVERWRDSPRRLAHALLAGLGLLALVVAAAVRGQVADSPGSPLGLVTMACALAAFAAELAAGALPRAARRLPLPAARLFGTVP